MTVLNLKELLTGKFVVFLQSNNTLSAQAKVKIFKAWRIQMKTSLPHVQAKVKNNAMLPVYLTWLQNVLPKNMQGFFLCSCCIHTKMTSYVKKKHIYKRNLAGICRRRRQRVVVPKQ